VLETWCEGWGHNVALSDWPLSFWWVDRVERKRYRAKEQLILIHIDLCGPITLESYSGKRYFISFINDFSRKIWVYFLKENSKVFEVFKRFKEIVKKEMSITYQICLVWVRRWVHFILTHEVLWTARDKEIFYNTILIPTKRSYREEDSNHP